MKIDTAHVSFLLAGLKNTDDLAEEEKTWLNLDLIRFLESLLDE